METANLTTDYVIDNLKQLVEFHTIQRGRCLEAIRALRGETVAPPSDPAAPVAKAPAMPKLRAPRKAAARDTSRARPSSKPHGDAHWQGVAEVCRDAQVDGRPMRQAVMAVFNVNDTTAGNWITKVQAKGLVQKLGNRKVESPDQAAEPAVETSRNGWAPGMAAKVLAG